MLLYIRKITNFLHARTHHIVHGEIHICATKCGSATQFGRHTISRMLRVAASSLFDIMTWVWNEVWMHTEFKTVVTSVWCNCSRFVSSTRNNTKKSLPTDSMYQHTKRTKIWDLPNLSRMWVVTLQLWLHIAACTGALQNRQACAWTLNFCAKWRPLKFRLFSSTLSLGRRCLVPVYRAYKSFGFTRDTYQSCAERQQNSSLQATLFIWM